MQAAAALARVATIPALTAPTYASLRWCLSGQTAIKPEGTFALLDSSRSSSTKITTHLPGGPREPATYAPFRRKRPSGDAGALSIPLARREFLQWQRRQIGL